MSKLIDLIESARTVCTRYEQGRIARETVREWVLRLGSYPAPHGDRVKEAAAWFRAHARPEVEPDIRRQDIEKLRAIVAPSLNQNADTSL